MARKEKIFGEDRQASANQKPESAPTILGATTVVVGDISSTGKLDIQGIVNGNIETSSDLLISGSVEGNVRGKNVVMQKATVKGNIEALHDVVLKKSVILGDVKANNVILDAKMKGDFLVQESTELTSNAILVGNIVTKDLTTQLGAKINGTITTSDANLKDNDFSFDPNSKVMKLEVSGTVIEDDEK
jgi:cytoskeletal protein CcmA (bactofilin family)